MGRVLFPILAAALALVGVACSQPTGAGGAVPFDQQFVDMMVPHHQGAVEAARAAETRAQRPEIKKLAGAIIAAQEREVAQMKEWRRA